MADENRSPTRFQIGDLILDTGAHTLTRNGDEIQLTRLSFALFVTLVRQAPKLMTQDELLSEVWGEVVVSNEALKQRIKMLRQAIGDASDTPRYVASVRGLGYRLIAPVKILSEREPLDAGEAQKTTSPVTGKGFVGMLQRRIVAILVSVALLIVGTVGFYFLIYARDDTQTTKGLSNSKTEIPRLSVAVLPFENISGDEANEPFTIGIHDDLITYISKIGSIKTISRTSVLQYRDTIKSVPQIAEELGVATVLEGGVQRSGDRVRINVQLVAAERDQHLWAETYDRELSTQNIFAIQSDIARAIANTLQATLLARDQANLTRMPTESMEAYQAYLLGRQRMISRTSATLEEAAGYFQRAAELDPKYALAYVGLADTYMLLGDYGALSLDEMLSKAEPAVDKALELNGQLAEAYTSTGAIRTKAGDYAAAEAAYTRAMELDPNYALAYHWYGDLLVAYLQQPEAAVILLERALELDPLSPAINVTLGQAFAGLGRFEEAMARYRKAIEIEPAYPNAYSLIAHLYKFTYGQLDDAIRWRREGVLRGPRNTTIISNLANDYLDVGDDAQAEYWIDRAMTIGPRQARPNSAIVRLHFYRNQEVELLQAARRLLEISPGNNAAYVALIRLGQYEEVRQGIAASYPELLCDKYLMVTRSNIYPAINFSLAMEESGERACSDLLLENALEFVQTIPRLGYQGHGIADVQIYARQGMKWQALATLRRAIDQGWLASWWMAERDPNLKSLHDEPEFQAMLDEIKADMAAQLERVRAMEASGELEPIPEVN